MLKCSFCLAAQVPNTIFCSECGHYLLDSESPETNPLETGEMEGAGEEAETSFVEVGSPSSSTWPVLLRLVIGENKRMVEILLDKAICLGRLDPASNAFPEVDLSPDTATLKGVSRRHARILKYGETVVVEDLGSVNGTFVNNRRLAPYLPEALNHGDILKLGKLQVEVRLHKQ